jgi:hypothetical protein
MNEIIGDPQPQILGASESLTPPGLGAGRPSVSLLLGTALIANTYVQLRNAIIEPDFLDNPQNPSLA